MAKVRLITVCIKCNETFTKLIDDEVTKGTVKLVCPFCGHESKVEFVDRSIKYVYKGGTKTFGLNEVIQLPIGDET
jgi:DNA-directed RNA polymerase subunit RPC12/RpoP